MTHSNLFDTIFKCSCKHKGCKSGKSGKSGMMGGSIGNGRGISGSGISSNSIINKTQMLSSSDFLALLNEKKTFLLMVFSNLIVQLGITYYITMNYNIWTSGSGSSSGDKKKDDPSIKRYFYLLFFIQITIILILALVPMPSFLKFIVFSIFSTTFGISLSYLVRIHNSINTDLVQMTLIGTASIFGLMFLLGVLLIIFGLQLGIGFFLFLFFALLLLIIGRIVMMFTSSYSFGTQTFSTISLFLFALYILYDTNHILQRNYYGDFITASLDYYLDIINIFVNLFSLNNN
jgi:FtsH-binding integral membrane protein